MRRCRMARVVAATVGLVAGATILSATARAPAVAAGASAPGFPLSPVSGLPPSQALGQVNTMLWSSGDPQIRDHLDYAKFGEYGPPSVAGTGYPMPAAGESATEYFLSLHPDWIMYQDDRSTIAYYGEPDHGYLDTSVVPLDISNPAVQQYVAAITTTHALRYHYDGILFDHGTVLNKYARAGHFTTSGVWVQEYTGQEIDSGYDQAMVADLTAIVEAIRSRAAAAGVNPFIIGLNDAPDLKLEPSWWAALLAPVDMLFDEHGFTKNVTQLEHVASSRLQDPTEDLVTNPWLQIVQDYQALQAQGKTVEINALLPYQISPSSPPSSGDVEWVLATYMAVAEPGTTLNFFASGVPSPGVPFLYPTQYQWNPAYAAPVGTKTGNLTPLGNGAYFRQFSSGATFVNPSLSPVTVDVPAGYDSLQGIAAPAGATILDPTSGLVLIRATAMTPAVKAQLSDA